MLKKIVRSLFILIILLFMSSLAMADNSTFSVPYYSYTYDYWSDPVEAPQAYQPYRVISGAELGIGDFKNPGDIFSFKDSEIYIADTGNNRIVIVNEDWELINVISGFKNKGKKDTFNGPHGIHVSSEGNIYVADRNNSRIVVLNKSGNLVRIIGSPVPANQNLFDKNFVFSPVKVSVDNVGRVYVIADKVYDGIMEFDVGGNFKGFLGAPRVNPNITDYLWRKFSPQARRERLSLILPTEYSNLDVDEKGFIYTTVASGQIREEEAVRRLNPSGDDVLKREGFAPPIGDYGSSLRDEEGNYILPGSSFVDIISREEGIYSVLDKERNRVFTYEYYGHLLYVFGGEGRSRGNLKSPVALTSLKNQIMVLDDQMNTITVFSPTNYQKLIHTAIMYYNDGEYQKSAEVWDRVRNINTNYDLAYTGIGKAYLRQDDFAEAMQNFKIGQNRQSYSKAFNLYRKEVVRDNINKFVIAIVLLIVLIKYREKIFGKISSTSSSSIRTGIAKAEVAAYSTLEKDNDIMSTLKGKLGIVYLQLIRTIDGLKYTKYLIFHPFEGFWDLKHERRGNVPAATVIIFLLTLTYVIQRQYTGFIFNSNDVSDLNILFEFVSILIPFMLWVTVNWSFTTLMNGKGTYRDIYIASAYAFTPIIYINIPATIISNFLTGQEGVIIYSLMSLSLIWSLYLLFFGIMTIHHYDTGKNLFTTVLIMGGIAFSLFIGILFFSLGEQVVRFITELYNEIFMRV